MSLPLSKENPARELRDVTISQLRLQGKSMREIADELDISKMTVSRVLKDDDIKEIIEAGTQELVRTVPRAVANLQEFATGDDKQHKYNASIKILEISGVAPGKVQNQYITTIYQQNNATIVSPVVLQAMQGFLTPPDTTDEAEIIDND